MSSHLLHYFINSHDISKVALCAGPCIENQKKPLIMKHLGEEDTEWQICQAHRQHHFLLLSNFTYFYKSNLVFGVCLSLRTKMQIQALRRT